MGLLSRSKGKREKREMVRLACSHKLLVEWMRRARRWPQHLAQPETPIFITAS